MLAHFNREVGGNKRRLDDININDITRYRNAVKPATWRANKSAIKRFLDWATIKYGLAMPRITGVKPLPASGAVDAIRQNSAVYALAKRLVLPQQLRHCWWSAGGDARQTGIATELGPGIGRDTGYLRADEGGKDQRKGRKEGKGRSGVSYPPNGRLI